MHATFALVSNARLPRWSLAADWPAPDGEPLPADIHVVDGRVSFIRPHRPQSPAFGEAVFDAAAAPTLPALVEAHAHLDKAYTAKRLGRSGPGLLAAIDAMKADRERWTAADVRARAARGLREAFASGVTRLRTHCDWWEGREMPLAWAVLRDLAGEWAGRIVLDRVALVPLDAFADRGDADAIARAVARSGPGALLGGFVHTRNWDPQALRNLLHAALVHDLDVDLHCDEELDPAAQGLETTAATLRALGFERRVVCSHTCALAAKPRAQAFAVLDALADLPVTLIALPITNLLLQDAQTDVTPRLRGLTLVKEARARGIPVMFGTDNVQDPFSRHGHPDPVHALSVGAMVAQLGEPFDAWSDAICRGDWLGQAPGDGRLRAGDAADFVVFGEEDDAGAWPTRAHARTLIRDGRVVPRAMLQSAA